jgi:uncharacterized protein (UPF0261 family)
VHNAQITLMRTDVEENRLCARWIAGKINRSHTAMTLVIPERSTSLLSAAGQPFHDHEADAALIDELTRSVVTTPARRIVRHDLDLNDPAFADALIDAFHSVLPAGQAQRSSSGPMP